MTKRKASRGASEDPAARSHPGPPMWAPNGYVWHEGNAAGLVEDGARVAIFWIAYDCYFTGVVEHTDKSHGWTTVAYDDRTRSCIDLRGLQNIWWVARRAPDSALASSGPNQGSQEPGIEESIPTRKVIWKHQKRRGAVPCSFDAKGTPISFIKPPSASPGPRKKLHVSKRPGRDVCRELVPVDSTSSFGLSADEKAAPQEAKSAPRVSRRKQSLPSRLRTPQKDQAGEDDLLFNVVPGSVGQLLDVLDRELTQDIGTGVDGGQSSEAPTHPRPREVTMPLPSSVDEHHPGSSPERSIRVGEGASLGAASAKPSVDVAADMSPEIRCRQVLVGCPVCGCRNIRCTSTCPAGHPGTRVADDSGEPAFTSRARGRTVTASNLDAASRSSWDVRSSTTENGRAHQPRDEPSSSSVAPQHNRPEERRSSRK